MTQLTGYDLVTMFEKTIPLWLAEEGDPVGLHVGNLSRVVKKVLVTLDVRPEVVEEAIENNVDFILAHHPPIYKPIERLDLSQPQNKMYADLIKHDITVYAAHTNLDNATDGMNDWLSEALELKDLEIMSVSKTIPLKRLNVYVPLEDVERVRLAMTQAGAGKISNDYQDCSYSVQGIGRFTPIEAAKPTIGQVGKPEEVAEERIEVILENSQVESVLKAMLQAHPYEEPVYEIYSIDQNQNEVFGLGRVGNLPEEMTIRDCVAYIKKAFNVTGVRLVIPPNTSLDCKVKRVALCGGDAGKYYKDAIRKQADIYITGDVYYHTAHDMQADGLTVIDPGHIIEKICIPKLANILETWKKEKEWEIEIVQSQIDTNPFIFDHEL